MPSTHKCEQDLCSALGTKWNGACHESEQGRRFKEFGVWNGR